MDGEAQRDAVSPGVGVTLPAQTVEKCPDDGNVLKQAPIAVQRQPNFACSRHNLAPGVSPDVDLTDRLAHARWLLLGRLRCIILERVRDSRQLFALREVVRENPSGYKCSNARTAEQIANKGLVKISQCFPCTSVFPPSIVGGAAVTCVYDIV
jgi:hypothetical protein